MFAVPFRLSQVCSRWRNLVIFAPQLWSTIFLDLREKNPNPALESYLERSEDLPLDITVYDGLLRGQSDNWSEADGAWVFQTIMKCCMPRLRRLSMLVYNSRLVFAAELPSDPTFQCLEFLHIRGSHSYPAWFYDAICHAPGLETIVLEDEMIFPRRIFSTRSGLRSLKALQLSGARGHLIPEILSHPTLESLVIANFHQSIPSAPSTSSHSLRHISLPFIRYSHALLQSAYLPNLESMSIRLMREFNDEKDLLSLLSKYASSVRKFRLLSGDSSILDDSGSRIIHLVHSLPNVTQFEIIIPSLRSSPAGTLQGTICRLFSVLARGPKTGLCLESFTIILGMVTLTEKMIDGFLEMVEHRVQRHTQGAVSPMKSAYLAGANFRHSRKEEAFARKDALEAQGVRCDFSGARAQTPDGSLPWWS
ncbi:hypothetical protein V5O48_016651 [Marasmius crinis-equi]|uniref:F-box domain-containing protein n=1 Tax=Marasmius crinis-equi TaxID=585013 RepID=A0ABR3ER69_9AGAR